ncbi:hypothetical protein LJC20_07365, partial [Eubacteriales bacterium OttesenSCG-928-M02]|nr:hypothetical protein [Eubacteriales bacterium OttesenSCG-928-M02]
QSTAWLLVDMLTDAVAHGTGTNARVSGQTTAGKTGTNDSYRGITFAGFTGYYACTVYIGHDDYKQLSGAYGGSFSAPLFKQIMTKIHEGLPNQAIISESPEQMGLIKASVCRESGMKPTSSCSTTSGWFPADSPLLSQTCDRSSSHRPPVTICTESGMRATAYCPNAEVVPGGSAPEETCNIHTQPPTAEPTPEPTTTPDPNAAKNQAIQTARNTISWAQQRMSSYGSRISSGQRSEINNLISTVNSVINSSGSTVDVINAATNNLQRRANEIFTSIDNTPTPTDPPDPTPGP